MAQPLLQCFFSQEQRKIATPKVKKVQRSKLVTPAKAPKVAKNCEKIQELSTLSSTVNESPRQVSTEVEPVTWPGNVWLETCKISSQVCISILWSLLICGTVIFDGAAIKGPQYARITTVQLCARNGASVTYYDLLCLSLLMLTHSWSSGMALSWIRWPQDMELY